ncbi:hypothetical protein [Hoeflea sp. TYP-13]|uniref:hypothetical protein n=1 Tax=Hoeflea sp. TYP-13 TaxID=3230023 RepID=UPI0034C60141
MNIGSIIAVGVFGVVCIAVAADLPPRTLNDKDYEELVAWSDDLERYGTSFAGAARWLIEARICSESDLRENGGWVKSQTHRDMPIYFSYCGGSTLPYRVYFNAETFEFYGRARGNAEAVRLAS